MILNKDNLITDWQGTIGLRAICVTTFTLNEYDDPITFTVITFDNGKVAVQRDQSSWTTSGGLLNDFEVDKWRIIIEQATATEDETHVMVGNAYTFEELEKYLQKNVGKALIVTLTLAGVDGVGIRYVGRAIMHVFGVNFCGDWKRGDGVLFYSDSEVHAAEPNEVFTVLQIIQY